MRLNHLIPSMYQRRLLLLAGGMLACVALPAAQMASLTLGKGERSLADAEKRLISETWLESSRGRIVDRKGRPLAMDRPSLDVSVSYDVISGRWVDQMAARAARRAKARTGAAVSQEDIAAARLAFEKHLADMWRLFAETAGISEADVKQRRNEVVEQVQYLAAIVTEQQRKREADRRERVGNTEAVASADVKVTIVEQQQSHVLLRGLSDQVGMQFERLKGLMVDQGEGGRAIPLMPGLSVQDSSRREYPQDVMSVPVDTSVFPPPLRGGVREIVVPGVAMHSIGRLRGRLYKEDMDRRPRIDPSTGQLDRGYYRPGDSVGHGGVEQAREDTLRGLRGLKIKHLDTGEEEIVPREPGGDVSLTLDAALQARIQALFDPSLGLTVVQPWHKTKRLEEEPKPPGAPKELPVGTALNGAVVVIDVASGDVLALVSMPSYSHEQIDKMPETIASDTYNQAFLNRAIARVYPPGSIVKPLVLCEAIREGLYAPDQHIACSGHFYPDQPTMYRCWIYKQFKTTHSVKIGHDLDGADGIRCSCNIFFFEMGRRLGPQGMFDTYTTYGVGRDGGAFNLFGLPPLPADPKDRVKEQRRRGLLFEAEGEVRDVAKSSTHEAVLMAIGQGPVTWTPLHAANAYATLARRGVRVLPRIYADGVQERTDLKIPGAAIDQALKGLYGSANERDGTTHTITYTLSDGSTTTEDVFTAPGVTVWAKSGTADTNPFAANLPGAPEGEDGKEMYDSDHSWCVCLVGVGHEPRYAIACVVDYGGSGGRVAGPVANQVVYALVGEGYLPDPRGTGYRHAPHGALDQRQTPQNTTRSVVVPTEGH